MIEARQEDRRKNQKARTRAAIVESAQRLQDAGEEPTVALAAERAGVSRATAYRYFPTQESLLVELGRVRPAVAPVEEVVEKLAGDAENRLVQLLSSFGRVVLENEADMRMAQRVYQDIWLRSRRGSNNDYPTLREGRRVRWLDRVLEPLDLTDEARERLRNALCLTVGIEAMTVMKDVCRLEDEEALEVLRWAALALLRAGLAEAGRPDER